MNAEFLDEVLLQRLAATLLSEFKNVRIYQPSALALHFVASNGSIDIERQLGATGKPILDDQAHYARNGINGPVDLVAALLVDEPGVRTLAADLEPITDDNNRMAVDSNTLALGLGVPRLSRLTADVDPLLNPDSWLRRSLSETDVAPVAWRLLWDGQVQRVQALKDSLERASARDLLQAMLYRYEGNNVEMRAALARIGPGEPVFEQAVFLSVIDDVHSVTSGERRLEDLQGLDLENSRFGAVLRGWVAQGSGDWQQLFSLERSLQATRVSDLWAPQAAKLRAAWRLEADDPDGRFAREALLLLDNVLASNATVNTYAMRARAGLKLEDDAIFIESVAFMLNSIDYRLTNLDYYGGSLGNAERRWLLNQLVEFGEPLRAVDRTGRGSLVFSKLLDVEKWLASY
jgi:hypothetical protein